MMGDDAVNLTRTILENLRNPEQLDEHAWAGRRFVREAAAVHPGLAQKSAGYQLAYAVGELFGKTIPGAAPKRGKRLDTRWGAFGMLAAAYFGPFLYGEPYPGALRDAWGRIDEAILLFRFGKEQLLTLSDEEMTRYRLVGDELDVAPLSTISDWHRKGIELLAEAIEAREAHLEHAAEIADGVQAAVEGIEGDGRAHETRHRPWKWVGNAIGLALLVGLILAGMKGFRIYQLVGAAQEDLRQVKNLAAQPVNTAMLEGVGTLLVKVRVDIDALQAETSPYLRLMGPWLKWVPGYGEDIAAAADLLDLAELLVNSVDTLYQVGLPIYDSFQKKELSLEPKRISDLLLSVQPQLAGARRQVDAALSIWEKYKKVQFSAKTEGLLKEIEQPIELLDDGLSVAIALPKLLGASNEGPKTYMLLVQNEDELRPTGGFITSVGTFVVKDGGIFGMDFEDSGELEDWSLPYPDAPWQLRDYMNAKVLVLRDANWFTDYPTSVSWIEYLYAYTHQHSVDGVIAVDQQTLVTLLGVIGTLNVDEIKVPITAKNVVEYMRAQKRYSLYTDEGVIRKLFIKQIGIAIAKKLTEQASGIDWRLLLEKMTQMLVERHILLQFDDPQVTKVLANWEFDGSVRVDAGDFLMVVDSNIGFNKTNAIVEKEFTYDIDLERLDTPRSTLVVLERNQAPSTRSCIQFSGIEIGDKYPIDYCYWNYLRIYVPAGTQLTGASPHQIPADWMLLQEPVPARVDTLDEKIAGVQGYGTLVVVPGEQVRDTRFEFALPARVVSQGAGAKQYAYSLKIKKQPGTLAIPATVRVHLPPGARVDTVNAKAVIDGANILVEINLRNDVLLTVTFTVP